MEMQETEVDAHTIRKPSHFIASCKEPAKGVAVVRPSEL